MGSVYRWPCILTLSGLNGLAKRCRILERKPRFTELITFSHPIDTACSTMTFVNQHKVIRFERFDLIQSYLLTFLLAYEYR